MSGPHHLCSPDAFLSVLIALSILHYGAILVGMTLKAFFRKMASLRADHFVFLVFIHKSALFPTEDIGTIARMCRSLAYFLHSIYSLPKHKSIPSILALNQHTGHNNFTNINALRNMFLMHANTKLHPTPGQVNYRFTLVLYC